MIFVPFVETRRNLFFICFGRVVRRLIFWQGFHEIVGRKPNKNKSNIFTPDMIIGLRAHTLSNTNQYFYFLAARYYIWTCKIKEVLPKIEIFPSFLYF